MAETRITDQVQRQEVAISKLEQKIEHNHEITLQKVEGLKDYLAQQMTIQRQQMDIQQEEREEKRRQERSENRKWQITNLFAVLALCTGIVAFGVKFFYHNHEDAIYALHKSEQATIISNQCMNQTQECLKATLSWKFIRNKN